MTLQWIICLLRCNKLLLRHLIIEIDGTTTGPSTYSGTIGKAINKCDSLPVCSFAKIILPDLGYVETITDLSTDQ